MKSQAKRLTTTAAILVAVLTNSYAYAESSARKHRAPTYGMAGCGIGSVVVMESDFPEFMDSPKESRLMQIVAAFFNGYQTFSITTGTSKCKGDKDFALEEQKVFVAMNFNGLKADAARGSGDYLSTWSELLGCDGLQIDKFGAAIQQNFDEVFASSQPLDIIAGTRNALGPNSAASCLRLGS